MNSHMSLTECLLTPCDLYLAENAHASRLAIMGTCLAEHLVNAGASKNLPLDHHLWETWAHAPIPDIDIDHLDGIIIHLTLRHILDMTVGIGLGDVSYINNPIDELGQQAADILTKRIDEIVQHFSGKLPLFFLSFIEPPQTTKGFFHNNRTDSIYRLVRNLNDVMAQRLSQSSGAYYVEVNDILSYYGSGESADSYHQHFTHAGNFGSQQSDNFYLAILQRVTNALETLRASSPVKLIITDLDNTLWNGVAAEQDEIIPWAHIEGWPIGYAEALLECKRRGILLAVCSKNDETLTIDNFRKIWSEKIKPEDFFSLKINWNEKSANIREILNEANILPAHVLFIDDNPLEIEEVTRALPDIRVLSIPQQRWRNVLLHAPQLQNSTLTSESQNRTILIKAKVERDKIAQTMDRDDYLHSLLLKTTVSNVRGLDDKNFMRCEELLNKTNQFNTTGRRWSTAELTDLLANNGHIFIARVEDRMANHGLTALALIDDSKIIQVVMSCRVFGLGVETALLAEVMRFIQENNPESIVTAIMKDTGRNASSKDFYSRHGFALTEDDASEFQNWAANLRHIPSIPRWINLLA